MFCWLFYKSILYSRLVFSFDQIMHQTTNTQKNYYFFSSFKKIDEVIYRNRLKQNLKKMLQLFYYRVHLKWFLSIIFLFTRMFRREIRNLKWEASKWKVKKLLQLKLGIESQSGSALGVWNRFLQSRCFFEGLEIDRIWQESQLKVS